MESKVKRLTPYWEEKVWGGNRLREIKKLPSDEKKWGESFEVSSLSGKESRVGESPLSKYLTTAEQLPYLVKFIDTTANLSIQVHPNDQYAQQHENSKGKTECWIITDAEEGAGLFLGFRSGVEEEDFFKQLELGSDVSQLLNFIPVTRGDFFVIPAGAVHAIGRGITLLEVQQSSGITYRAWDWNRVGLDGKPRELHVDQCKEVLNFSALFQDSLLGMTKRDIFEISQQELLEIHDFKLSSYVLQAGEKLSLEYKSIQRLTSLILLDGLLKVDDEQLGPFSSCILTNEGSVTIVAEQDSSFIIVE